MPLYNIYYVGNYPNTLTNIKVTLSRGDLVPRVGPLPLATSLLLSHKKIIIWEMFSMENIFIGGKSNYFFMIELCSCYILVYISLVILGSYKHVVVY